MRIIKRAGRYLAIVSTNTHEVENKTPPTLSIFLIDTYIVYEFTSEENELVSNFSVVPHAPSGARVKMIF